jgi:hypothetical protein
MNAVSIAIAGFLDLGSNPFLILTLFFEPLVPLPIDNKKAGDISRLFFTSS